MVKAVAYLLSTNNTYSICMCKKTLYIDCFSKRKIFKFFFKNIKPSGTFLRLGGKGTGNST